MLPPTNAPIFRYRYKVVFCSILAGEACHPGAQRRISGRRGSFSNGIFETDSFRLTVIGHNKPGPICNATSESMSPHPHSGRLEILCYN